MINKGNYDNICYDESRGLEPSSSPFELATTSNHLLKYDTLSTLTNALMKSKTITQYKIVTRNLSWAS